MAESDLRIGVLTEAITDAGFNSTSNLIEIAKHFSRRISLVASPKAKRFFKRDPRISSYAVPHRGAKSALMRILRSAFFQVKISYTMIKLIGATDIWLFFIGGEYMVLPMLTMKLFRKKVLLVFAGSASETMLFFNPRLTFVARHLSRMNCALSDLIVLYSSVFITKWNLERYRYKIIIAGEHMLNFDQLKITSQFEQRPKLVGYLGRLSEEKGILTFIKAVPLIIKLRNDIKFLIVGDGYLSAEIAEYLANNDLGDKVSLLGWVEHNRISDYLNQLKLIVLPSHTEGLPNVMLEAMACGVPVLATRVGAVADIIRDGDTGFVIEKNTPECIAADVIRALEYPHIAEVIEKANTFVKSEHSYERIVRNWGPVFSALGQAKNE